MNKPKKLSRNDRAKVDRCIKCNLSTCILLNKQPCMKKIIK